VTGCLSIDQKTQLTKTEILLAVIGSVGRVPRVLLHINGDKHPTKQGTCFQIEITLNGDGRSFSVEHIILNGDALCFYGQKRDGSLGRLRHRIPVDSVYAVINTVSDSGVVWFEAMPDDLRSQPVVAVRFGSGLQALSPYVAAHMEEPTHVPYLRIVRSVNN